MFERCLEVRLPADLTNREYAALAHAICGLLHASGIGEVSAVRLDDRIGDVEMNAEFDVLAALNPWSRR
ncbi:hypothetical protein [Saccharothrix lopnurensis]|uniref:Uncharacterized protein n=1 Tax=Saccharothrix lopnurensis TaxID=1670621 RepID=A0ABW1PI55_9PSEU